MRRCSALAALAAFVSACGLLGGGTINVTARNEADQEMVVQVIDASNAPVGEMVTIAAGEERRITLGVPGGDWTVTVNGARLLTSSDAGSRRGELPITLILPGAEIPLGPYWEAPSGWAGSGP